MNRTNYLTVVTTGPLYLRILVIRCGHPKYFSYFQLSMKKYLRLIYNSVLKIFPTSNNFLEIECHLWITKIFSAFS